MNKDIGYVYIMMDPHLSRSNQNIIKIGKTTQTPEERRKGLNSTGSLKGYVLIYENFFESCSLVEKELHHLLKDYKVRDELFNVPIGTAMDYFSIVEAQYKTLTKPVAHAKTVDDMLRKFKPGDRLEFCNKLYTITAEYECRYNGITYPNRRLVEEAITGKPQLGGNHNRTRYRGEIITNQTIKRIDWLRKYGRDITKPEVNLERIPFECV